LEPQLRAWLRQVVPRGLEVDDLVQEAYAKLANLPSDTQITHPKAYLYQIAKRLIAEHIRRAVVVSIDAMTDMIPLALPEDGITPERILSAREELEGLYEAIARLPDSCRQVFILRKFHDMSQRDIAQALQISENSVEKRLTRALRKVLEYRTEVHSVRRSEVLQVLPRKERRDA
jgi:RNA polymerase sigma-70 factor (ECF subfamily)